MQEMDVSFEEVQAVLDHPVITYPGSPKYGAGRRVVVGGRLAVVIEDTTNVVVTVLWNRGTGRHGGEAA
jgi:hypothetical protein